MTKERTLRLTALATAVFALSVPAVAQAPELAMLDQLNRGGWELNFRGDGGRRSICVRNGREFIQLQHRQGGCSRFVVDDQANQVTVQYTCRGDGYGRTTIRREGNGLVQIRSQGIQGGAPFSIEGEARHTGAC
ncbi:hypothetical protein GCM10009127_07310 [Alteraurantiacibacter aestuarii]|uniref:DUF3617 family protein n=1 Tax=Alteraurantiacibacter aestuarii TaxID=650004 RepID=A0A844ZHT4_9SPHN|nr:hypothetical protein [Alteraurantiacibacter aestuarii]MXO87124.1 hypothetical protein [Alteraurantiacibacter aestuarii]